MNKDGPSLLPRHRMSSQEVEHQDLFLRLVKRCPIPQDERLRNLGLFLTGSSLARILFMDELYRRVLPVHGSILEFGVRWGQNLALWTELRGLYEPFNWNRKIVGFDTFEGYPSVHEKDGGYATPGMYTVTPGYERYLEAVLEFHEAGNPVSHLKKFELVSGDVEKTLPEFFGNCPESVIALAYFDLDLYEPTRICLELIQSRLTRGSVVGFDELNCKEDPGETLALLETWGLDRYAIRHSQFGRGNCYVIIT
jgi:hypothetical protein